MNVNELKKLFIEEEAQGMTEYILIIALVAIICVVSIRLFGKQIKDMITGSTDKIDTETKGFNK